MRNALLIVAVLSLSACNTLKRFTTAGSTPPDPIPEILTASGTTVFDYQIIPIRCADSAVTVKVKENGTWRECNRFEVKIDTVGAGGGAVYFRNICYPTFDSNGKLIYLVITGKPVAPKGTDYEIRSVLLHGSVHELY